MLSFSDTTSLCSSPAAAVALFESTHDDANTSNEGADYLSNSDIMEVSRFYFTFANSIDPMTTSNSIVAVFPGSTRPEERRLFLYKYRT